MRTIIITGQTATSKTKLAVDLAKKHNGELINADSRQIYKYLDIVTGKDLDKIGDIPVQLYDIVDPKKPFSSHDWVKLAKPLIEKLQKQGKTPIIVGGTYLYLKHLLYGLDTEGIEADWKLREELDNKSVEELQKMIDPDILKKMNQSDRNNPRRLIRKIEINMTKSEDTYFSQSLGFSRGVKRKKNIVSSEISKYIGLRYKSRTDLRKALQKRVEERIENGAVEEVESLLNKGYKLSDPGLSSNACLEISQYLTGDISKKELIDRWVTIEMQYAKRQLTFMSRDPNIQWKEL